MTDPKKKIIVGTAVVIFANLLLIVYLVSPHKPSPKPAKDLSGYWQGEVQAGDAILRMVINLGRDANGSYQVKLDSVDQGVHGIPGRVGALSNDTLRLEFDTVGAHFQGQILADGEHIDGEWQQLKTTLELRLTRTNQPYAIAAPLAAEAISPRKDSDLQGYWTGALDAGGTSLRVAVKISEPQPGQFAASFDSIDQGAMDMPITSFTYKKPDVVFELASVGGIFEGQLSPDANALDGSWTQGGRGLPLKLRRSTNNVAPPPAAAFLARSPEDIAGYWDGTVTANGVNLRLALQIAHLPGGEFNGWLDSIDQGARRLPTTSIRMTNQVATLEWKAMRASFQGQVMKDKFVGSWKQGPVAVPITFTRSDKEAAPSAK